MGQNQPVQDAGLPWLQVSRDDGAFRVDKVAYFVLVPGLYLESWLVDMDMRVVGTLSQLYHSVLGG